MRPDKEKLIAQATSLLASGVGCTEIGRRLGVGTSTIRRWLHPNEAEAGRANARDYYRRHIANVSTRRLERNAKKRLQFQDKYRNDPEFRQTVLTAKRDNRRQRQFGSLGELEVMLEAQGNCCAICNLPFDKPPHRDHCHASGQIRGLLCSACNLGLGIFKDDPARLRAAADYLDKYAPSI